MNTYQNPLAQHGTIMNPCKHEDCVRGKQGIPHEWYDCERCPECKICHAKGHTAFKCNKKALYIEEDTEIKHLCTRDDCEGYFSGRVHKWHDCEKCPRCDKCGMNGHAAYKCTSSDYFFEEEPDNTNKQLCKRDDCEGFRSGRAHNWHDCEKCLQCHKCGGKGHTANKCQFKTTSMPPTAHNYQTRAGTHHGWEAPPPQTTMNNPHAWKAIPESLYEGDALMQRYELQQRKVAELQGQLFPPPSYMEFRKMTCSPSLIGGSTVIGLLDAEQQKLAQTIAVLKNMSV